MRYFFHWRAHIFAGLVFLCGLGLSISALPQSVSGRKAVAAGVLEISDFTSRNFEGAPSLALTFSRPLDAKRSFDEDIRVFEMPRRGADGKDASAAEEDAEQNDTPDEVSANAKVSTAAADIAIDGGKLVKGSWVVGSNPRLLYFPHIKPQTRYVVRVYGSLASASKASLGKPASYSILTARVTPSYYFGSRGMVLPAKQNGGLPVVTVNVPEVDIQFLRVKSDQLPRFLDRVIAGPKPKRTLGQDEGLESEYGEGYDWRATDLKGAVNNWSLDSLNKLTESVFSGRFLAEKKANKRSVTFIPVEEIKELQTPGIYIAVMSQPNRFRYDYQVTYFYVSDLGLSTRLFSKGADAYVSSLSTGKAIPAVEVAWLDENGKTLAREKTDTNGRATFAERPASAKVIVAKLGAQLSLIAFKEPALDLSEYDTAGLPGYAVRLFAYSGRDLYRPGEAIDISVLARDADGRPVAPQPIQAILKRPDGKPQLTTIWQPHAKVGGYYLQRVEIPSDAPTGFWNLELRTDPADKRPAAVLRIGIEEFLPERMKLEINSAQAFVSSKESLSLDIKGSYLYGAPAAGNKLVGVANFERQKNPLQQKLPGFEFGDSGEDAIRHRAELPDVELSVKGEATIDIDLSPVEGKRSPYTVRTTLSLLESGGRPVIRNFERVVWPASALIGIRALFNGDYAREGSLAAFEVVRADASGKLLAGKNLPVRLFREDRDYYWRFDDTRGWHSGFSESDELVETATVTVPSGGRGKVMMPVKYGRYRLEVYDDETKQTNKYRFYAGWSARGDESQGQRPDRVALRFDKPAYKDGEVAKLTITPPHAGEALITVEADKTLWVKRISIGQAGATVEVPVDPLWKRHDLYVSVVVLRPGSEGAKVTPARALGLTHLPLDRSSRSLTVKLETQQKMVPDSLLKIKVKVPDAHGKQAVVTLSAVDAGILSITRFASPNPHQRFFGKLRYGADQYDVYGRLIEKLAGKKGKLKFGGDAAPKATKSLPKKVLLVDVFSGPVTLNEQGEADISLPIPDFNGSLRLMAVVSTEDRFGSAEAEVVVAAPLVAELLTPRFLTVGDSATVALDLNNLSGVEQKLKVRLENRDGLKIQNMERDLTLKNQQKQTLHFVVEAGTALGLSDVRLKVTGSTLKLERSFGLQVQAATPSQNSIRHLSINPGETIEIKDAELSGLLKYSVQSHLVISNKVPIDVRSAIQGLLTYPYGCVEQTTSTAFPHVWVDEIGAQQFGLKSYSREVRSDMLEKAVARLASMQAPNGGFSLWGNVSEYEYWLSAYVNHFLLEAREQGFKVPDAMQKSGTGFLLKFFQEGVAGLQAVNSTDSSNSWRDYNYGGSGRFASLAYGGYVLARESKAPLSTLRQMFDLRERAHSSLSLVELGLALRLMGDDAKAQVVFAEAIKKSRRTGWWSDYGSPMRDAALAYALLEQHKIKLDGMDTLVAITALELKTHRYTSTQEKLALFLMGRHFVNNANGTAWTAQMSGSAVSKEKPESIEGKGTLIKPITPQQLATGVLIKNPNKEKLFLELAVSGYPAKMPATKTDAIELKRDLFEADGRPLQARSVKVGESLLIRLRVNPKVWINTGMVIDRIPAGLEIENLNIAQGEGMDSVTVDKVNPAQAMLDTRIQRVEFRDDRFVVAARLHSPLNLYYRVRVVTPGKFIFPPIYAEDMYNPDVYGLSVGDALFTVTDGKTPDPALAVRAPASAASAKK